MGLLEMLGLGVDKQSLSDMITEGAVIVDVRSKGEYTGGHIKGSKNIPLDQISSNIEQLKKLGRPVVTCCASGMRSGSAASMLNKNGIKAMNGGGWVSLNSRLN